MNKNYPIVVESIDGQPIDCMQAIAAMAVVGLAGYETDDTLVHGSQSALTLYPLESTRGDRQVAANLRKAGFRKV
jgi:hypothetical protein